MRYSLFLVAASLVLVACSNTRWITGTSVETVDSERHLSNEKVGLDIPIYGDYRFEKLRKRTTSDLPPPLRKHLRKTGKSRVLFDAYTTIQPFGSVKGYWYRKDSLESVISKRQHFLEEQGVTQMGTNTLLFDSLESVRIAYTWNRTIGDSLHTHYFLEYLLPREEGVVSLLFWSDFSDKWLVRESEGIVRSDQP